jgi:flavin reductase (DIM6/NTAB) family NADH-FMN oxidoreductase RutF
MHLPTALKKILGATPQWQHIGLRFPQQSIEVRLVAAAREFNVTVNNAIAALKPLTIAIGLDAHMSSAIESVPESELQFIDPYSKRPIGILRLRRIQSWKTAGAVLGLFEVRSGRHRCARWPRRAWDRWMYQRAARKNSRPDSFSLAPDEVEQTMIFYLCPRPVFLVSVDDGKHSNVFPMDLVGPIAPDRFTLALRNTSPSVGTIQNERRVALSSIAAADYRIAYQLGAHHKKLAIDCDALPFELLRSRIFSLPVPAIALRVREIEVIDFQSIGSHTLFVGRLVSDEPRENGLQLFHTCGIHQRLRNRRNLPFPVP